MRFKKPSLLPKLISNTDKLLPSFVLLSDTPAKIKAYRQRPVGVNTVQIQSLFILLNCVAIHPAGFFCKAGQQPGYSLHKYF
jgi:hypothetical protein